MILGWQVPLWNRGAIVGYAKVSPEDVEAVAREQWFCPITRIRYATRWRQRTVLLHRELLGLQGSNLQGDHINRDTLDCRRENLRVVTAAQNMQNKRAHTGASRTSSHRGVYWDRSRGRWRAVVKRDGRRIFNRFFEREVDAALAVVQARARLMPFSEEGPW